jgi:uncharacterized protein YjbJ (UPF0337 family)
VKEISHLHLITRAGAVPPGDCDRDGVPAPVGAAAEVRMARERERVRQGINRAGEETMFKSSKRDRTEGLIDRVAGRVLEAIGALTGRRSHQAKGKAARARGRMRTEKGNVKRGRR